MTVHESFDLFGGPFEIVVSRFETRCERNELLEKAPEGESIEGAIQPSSGYTIADFMR